RRQRSRSQPRHLHGVARRRRNQRRRELRIERRTRFSGRRKSELLLRSSRNRAALTWTQSRKTELLPQWHPTPAHRCPRARDSRIARMKILRHLLVVFVLNASVFAAEPLFETTRIFAVSPNNKPNYRIPAILQAPNGDLLIFAEKRNDGPGDIGNHDIVC